MTRVRIIGNGRAGLSFAGALTAIGADVVEVLGRGADLSLATSDVDVVIIATPDGAIATVASSLTPSDTCVVLHLSGAQTLATLAQHPRAGSIHPLLPLPNAEIGAERLLNSATFAVAGDPVARQLAQAFGGRVVDVHDGDRATYHAAACVAANHVVGLLGQVERLANSIGLDLACFMDLTRAAMDDAATLGPQRALTGPAARGDWTTLERHLMAIPEDERPAYDAGVSLALQLATGLPGLGARVVVEPAPFDDAIEVLW
jgi:predicted short-subunit dehydrogenase-like oxidoreductase (DUF2520 family)